VEEALDHVTAALGMVWTRGFQIVPAGRRAGPPVAVVGPVEVTPTPPAGSALPQPTPAPDKLFSVTEASPVRPTPPEALAPAKSPDLAHALSDGLVRLMQVDPMRRGSAIRQFTSQFERSLRVVDGLTPLERLQQRGRLLRVYQSGLRMYRGLTPDQQQEFRPLFDIVRGWLKL
jgi:hypothetical protein